MIRTVAKRLVLRSPLHQTISRRFLLLTAMGDVELDPPIPLRYATHGGTHIVLGEPSTPWWKPLADAEQGRLVTVRFKGRRAVMSATLATGEALDEGVLRYLQKYPGEWRVLGVDASASAAEVEAAAQGVAVVLFTAAP